MHNVLIIFYIAFSIGNLFILPELERIPAGSYRTKCKKKAALSCGGLFSAAQKRQRVRMR